MDGLACQPRPRLIVTIDTEEEFDWEVYSSRSTSVRNIAEQHRTEAIYSSVGCVPTYLVTHSVASQAEWCAPLKDLCAGGRCLIGAHMHPWGTPPIQAETITNEQDTFPGNLPTDIEREKLTVLTEVLTARFGIAPTIYRAGRYGLGASSAKILGDLGYRVDTSVLPKVDLRPLGGPNFLNFEAEPFWLDRPGGVLELPLTSAYFGRLAGLGDALYPLVNGRCGRMMKVPAVLARLNLLNRVRLSPEGHTLKESIALTKSEVLRGRRILVVSYHSSSLLAGASPYSRTSRDVDGILDWLRGYFDFFLGEFGGELTTPSALYDEAIASLPANPSLKMQNSLANDLLRGTRDR